MFGSDVNIQPNRTGLPEIAALESIVGALLMFGLVASVAGIATSAIAWAKLPGVFRANIRKQPV